MIVTLLVASVLVVGVMQVLFAALVFWHGFYAPLARYAVCALVLASSAGAFAFVFGGLLGADVLLAAVLYQAAQAAALSVIVSWRAWERLRGFPRRGR